MSASHEHDLLGVSVEGSHSYVCGANKAGEAAKAKGVRRGSHDQCACNRGTAGSQSFDQPHAVPSNRGLLVTTRLRPKNRREGLDQAMLI